MNWPTDRRYSICLERLNFSAVVAAGAYGLCRLARPLPPAPFAGSIDFRKCTYDSAAAARRVPVHGRYVPSMRRAPPLGWYMIEDRRVRSGNFRHHEACSGQRQPEDPVARARPSAIRMDETLIFTAWHVTLLKRRARRCSRHLVLASDDRRPLLATSAIRSPSVTVLTAHVPSPSRAAAGASPPALFRGFSARWPGLGRNSLRPLQVDLPHGRHLPPPERRRHDVGKPSLSPGICANPQSRCSSRMRRTARPRQVAARGRGARPACSSPTAGRRDHRSISNPQPTLPS